MQTASTPPTLRLAPTQVARGLIWQCDMTQGYIKFKACCQARSEALACWYLANYVVGKALHCH